MSKAERLLSYTLQSLITSKSLASAPTTGLNDDDDDEEQEHSSTTQGHLNEDGAWCWRENCDSKRYRSWTVVIELMRAIQVV